MMAANCKKFYFLFIALGAIVRLAEHLAVGDIGRTAFRPSSYMVGIHFDKFPYTRAIGVVTKST